MFFWILRVMNGGKNRCNEFTNPPVRIYECYELCIYEYKLLL